MLTDLLTSLQLWWLLPTNRYLVVAGAAVVLAALLAARLAVSVEFRLAGSPPAIPTTLRQRLRALLRQSYFPLAGLLAGQLVSWAGVQLGRPLVAASIARLSGLFWFLLVYGLAAALVRQALPSERARRVIRLLVLPPLIAAIIAYLLGLWESLVRWLTLPRQLRPGVVFSVADGLLALAIVVGFIFLGRLLRATLRRALLLRGEADTSVADSLATIISYVIAFGGALVALSALGFDLTLLTVLGGALGVGIGFALQTVISNFISGLILLFDRAIRPGDVVRVDEHIGRVQRIGIRSTVIRTRDHVQLIVPNSDFLTGVVTNFSHDEAPVRVSIIVRVDYRHDPRRVEQLLLDAAAATEGCLREPLPQLFFTEMGETGMEFELRVWTNDPWGIPRLQSDLRFNAWERLHQAAITLALRPYQPLSLNPDDGDDSLFVVSSEPPPPSR